MSVTSAPSAAPTRRIAPNFGARRTVACWVSTCLRGASGVSESLTLPFSRTRLGARTVSVPAHRQHAGEVGAGAGCGHTPRGERRVPAERAGGELEPGGGIRLDDVRRGSARVARAGDRLGGPVGRHPHFDGVAFVVARELFEQVPHGGREGRAILGSGLPGAHGGAARIRVDPPPHGHVSTLPRAPGADLPRAPTHPEGGGCAPTAGCVSPAPGSRLQPRHESVAGSLSG